MAPTPRAGVSSVVTQARPAELVGDPFLDSQRAMEHLELGEVERALALATRSAQAVPRAASGWWAQRHCALAAGRFAEAREAMERLAGELGVPLAEVESGDDLDAFRASPEGAAWEAWKARRAAAR